MNIEFIPYLSELIAVSVIAIFMSISPEADFVMITRNSIFYGRMAGLYSSLGVSLAIWIHVAYSIAGLAIISLAHLMWFSSVSVFLSQPVLLEKFKMYKNHIEKLVGSLLIGFGLKVAVTSNG